MNVRLSKKAAKYLRSLDTKTQERLKSALRELSFEPMRGDIALIVGQRNVYRDRVGDFRLLFTVHKEDDVIIIDKIAPRGEAYKN